VIFGIVLSFILSTITFGQQNIRRYESRQQAEYRTEGAFEIALKLMESYVDPADEANKGIYYYLRNEGLMAPQDDPVFVFTIDGSEVRIGVELLKKDSQVIEARMFDLEQRQLKRLIRASANSEDDEDDGVPRYEEGVPVFRPEDGTIYEDFDGDIYEVTRETLLQGDFHTTGRLVITSSTPPIDVRGNKDINFDADGGIYLATDISTANYRSITLHSSSGHIYIGEDSKVETSNQMLIKADVGHIVAENAGYLSNSYGSITLEAGNYISLVNITIQSSNNIYLRAKHIYLENVTFKSVSNGVIHLHAEQSVTIKNSELDSSRQIDISAANGTLTVQDTKLKTSDSGIHLNAEQSMSIQSSELTSNKQVELSSANGMLTVQDTMLTSRGGRPIILSAAVDVNISGTTLDSSNYVHVNSGGHLYAQDARMSSPSWTDITLIAAGSISLEDAELNASRDLLFTVGSASQTVDVSRAYLKSSNNVAQVAPAGAVIYGTPVYGCVNNGVTQICS
jgi:hypothetical protein